MREFLFGILLNFFDRLLISAEVKEKVLFKLNMNLEVQRQRIFAR